LLTQVLAENKGGTVRDRPKGLSKAKCEPQARATKGSGNLECKTMSRRTETAYKAWSPGKSAGLPFRVQHDKALDSGDRVNAAVV